MIKRLPTSLLAFGVLAVVYLGLATVGTFQGAASIPARHVVVIVGGALGLADVSSVPEAERFLVLHVRLPQLILLGLVGAALAGSGAALQATFENPLADPGVLGVSGGAALGAVLAIHVGLAQVVFFSLPLCAFGGGLVAALVLYVLTFLGGRPTVHSLLLTGVAVGTIATAGVSFVMVNTPGYQIQELLFWLVGGVRDRTWEHVWLAAPIIALAVAGLLFMHRSMDALLLGEEQALAVGVHVVQTRLLLLMLTALATGAATAVAGTIGFVGLIVPHMIRHWTGPRALHLVPVCLAGGAVFLTACHLAARALSEHVALHLGILTAFLGGPAFLILLRKGPIRLW